MVENPLQGREVIIEFFSIGNCVKITAMDTKTLTEISIQGPTTVSKSVLETNALKRLAYVMKKKGLI